MTYNVFSGTLNPTHSLTHQFRGITTYLWYLTASNFNHTMDSVTTVKGDLIVIFYCSASVFSLITPVTVIDLPSFSRLWLR